MDHQHAMRLIHVARRNLAMSEDAYRAVVRDIGGAESGSAKDLSPQGVEAVLDHFKSLGWLPTKLGGHQVTKLHNRRGGMATQKQIRMLLAIWVDAARTPTEAAFNHFLKNRYGVSHYRFLRLELVPKLKVTLEAMRDAKAKKEATGGNISPDPA